jgi:hypothetical protein
MAALSTKVITIATMDFI